MPKLSDPALIVGFDTADDACVYQISEDMAIIQTADFFPPMVDDPYLFGKIAAANALSDVYAMGGVPKLALNLLCVNPCLGDEVVKEILRGGADQAIKAGCIITGGHTIEDNIPKYGLSVTGFVHPGKVRKNVGSKPGDVLILTKPVGSGILLTALKAEFIEPRDCELMFESMAALNQEAGAAMEGLSVHACTDITGFGLLGHLYEMASGSEVTISVFADKLPLFPLTEEMARTGMVPAGAYRNFDYIKSFVKVMPDVDQALIDIASDAQTSGGLCISLPEEEADILLKRLEDAGEKGYIIGKAKEETDKKIELTNMQKHK